MIYTFETLAKAVADDLNEAIKFGGFDDFKEMRRNYDWTAKDIRDEITHTAQSFLNEEYSNLCKEYDGWENIPWEISTDTITMMDDGRMEQKMNEITYGTFKKMVMSHVK